VRCQNGHNYYPWTTTNNRNRSNRKEQTVVVVVVVVDDDDDDSNSNNTSDCTAATASPILLIHDNCAFCSFKRAHSVTPKMGSKIEDRGADCLRNL
jgi:hypothetical protein